MEEETPVFADVILPLHIPKLYTYSIPRDMTKEIGPGMRVVVPLRNKLYTGIVRKVHAIAPDAYTARAIEYPLDPEAVISELQLKFWDWLSSYYLAYPGDVLQAALPSVFKLSSETLLSLSEEADLYTQELNEREYTVLEALRNHGHLSLKAVAEILELKSSIAIVKGLIEKGLVNADEDVKERFKPKKAVFIRLHSSRNNEDALNSLFDALQRAPRQSDILLRYLASSPEREWLNRSILLDKGSSGLASVKTLVEKGIFEEREFEIGRLDFSQLSVRELPKLSLAQKASLKELKECWEDKEVSLLHGYTGSGKTHVYFSLIKEQLEMGKQVFYLVPEIGLTTQLIKRIKTYFGNDAGIYHSRMNEQERAEVWRSVADEKYKIVLGVRSSVFLPFRKLGLVIVDEEHDSSLKQFEPNPRFHGRDAAMMLAHLHKAKVLLGSASPSIESFYLALNGKFGLVRLYERHGAVPMPEIKLIDLKEAKKNDQIKEHYSKELVTAIKNALANREQVILLQNRRGYYPVQECEDCGWSPFCKNCDIPLNYHKFSGMLICHYCSYSMPQVETCQGCGSPRIRAFGFGTEKAEEALKEMIPEARIKRVDQDTTRGKKSFAAIIDNFEQRKIDILVGTQMVSKGLDFENVRLVGVLNADRSLRFPNFRAEESTFQLLSQVAGRSGRKFKRGLVLMQTKQPGHPLFQSVIDNDYAAFYQREIQQRAQFYYPPFCRLVRITLKHKTYEILNEASKSLAMTLNTKLDATVLGPATPAISKLRSYYLREILVKLRRGMPGFNNQKNLLIEHSNQLRASKDLKGIIVVVDVDPH